MNQIPVCLSWRCFLIATSYGASLVSRGKTEPSDIEDLKWKIDTSYGLDDYTPARPIRKYKIKQGAFARGQERLCYYAVDLQAMEELQVRSGPGSSPPPVKHARCIHFAGPLSHNSSTFVDWFQA